MDNAIALAIIARSLPQHLRKKALFIGLFSAILFRSIGILSIAYFIHLSWIQWIGGAYLIYLSLAYFFSLLRKKKHTLPSKRRNFFLTVLLIEGTDLLFALDSILAGLALIGITVFHPPNFPPKLWIVYVGAVLGLIGMRFTAHLFTRFLEIFPRMEMAAHLVVGWIGLKLVAISSIHQYAKKLSAKESEAISFLFWGGIALFFLFGFIKKRSCQKQK